MKTFYSLFFITRAENRQTDPAELSSPFLLSFLPRKLFSLFSSDEEHGTQDQGQEVRRVHPLCFLSPLKISFINTHLVFLN